MVLSLRETLYLPLDDLLYITKQYINPEVSRSGGARLLKRHGMSKLADMIPKAAGEVIAPKKTFKCYEPGFIHIDIKYMPKMADETSRHYLFVAIDRATRWVFLYTYADMTEVSSVDFLRRLKLASSIKITKILADNGAQFTDRFTSKNKNPSGRHAFDVDCASHRSGARLGPAPAPANERHGRALQWSHQRVDPANPFRQRVSEAVLEATLQNYLKLYTSIFRNAPSMVKRRYKRSRNGLNKSPIYLLNGFMIGRNLKLMLSSID